MRAWTFIPAVMALALSLTPGSALAQSSGNFSASGTAVACAIAPASLRSHSAMLRSIPSV